MRSLHLAGPLLAFVTAFAAYGCTLNVAGLSPGETSTSGMPSSSSVGGAGPSTASASTGQAGGGGGGGASASSSASISAASSSSTGCPSTVEICNNGVDDTCDGLVDCADPQCMTPTGSACVDAAPAGWALTAILPGAATCPAGYDTPVAVAPAPASAANTCDCKCGAMMGNPCTTGMLTVKIGSICTANTVTSAVTGGCDTFAGPAGSHQSCGGAPLALTSVACATTVTKPAAGPSTIQTMCSPTASGAPGCGAGQTCVPAATSVNLCIQATGDMACPAGPYTARTVVGTPGDLKDNRSCGACACTSDATSCGAATFTAYTDASCTLSPASVAIDSTCHNAAANSFSADTHFTYQSAPTPTTCSAGNSKPTLTGQFDPNSPITICCKP